MLSLKKGETNMIEITQINKHKNLSVEKRVDFVEYKLYGNGILDVFTNAENNHRLRYIYSGEDLVAGKPKIDFEDIVSVPELNPDILDEKIREYSYNRFRHVTSHNRYGNTFSDRLVVFADKIPKECKKPLGVKVKEWIKKYHRGPKGNTFALYIVDRSDPKSMRRFYSRLVMFYKKRIASLGNYIREKENTTIELQKRNCDVFKMLIELFKEYIHNFNVIIESFSKIIGEFFSDVQQKEIDKMEQSNRIDRFAQICAFGSFDDAIKKMLPRR